MPFHPSTGAKVHRLHFWQDLRVASADAGERRATLATTIRPGRATIWEQGEGISMGFMSGVITGVAVAAGAAAWYMSRSGERFRDQYRVDRKLGEFGDQLEARTRDIRASATTQIADLRATAADAAVETDTRLDDAQASAAEAAAELAADVESRAASVKEQAKDSASG